MNMRCNDKKNEKFSRPRQNKAKCLPEDRTQALRDLHINPTHSKRRDESGAFLLYLNYAVNNICDITKIDKNTSEPQGAVNQLKEKKISDPGVFRRLSNFFWLFNEDDPERDFPNYEEITLAIVEKIYDLRNYFAHLNKKGVEPLTVNRDMFVLVEGILAHQAREKSVKPGLRTAKLFKMKLFGVRDKEEQIYDFTRRGLIFFICLALYKDEAMEFTQCLEDMKLPACPRKLDLLESDCDCQCEDFAACKPGVAKAFVTMFTYFSARRGRSVNFLQGDLDYLSFADITGYLNKVPAESMEYLTLDQEKNKLKALADASSKLEENRIFKYSLHKRFRDRFLSFCTGYCEDFGILPHLKFKRFDTSVSEGRKRYFFGTEHDNRVHMDRHYHIENNAVRFAWTPSRHYGPIHIDSLRSTLSSTMMKEILFGTFSRENVDREIEQYFTAYHRILETLINIQDVDEIYLEENSPLVKDFATVSGMTPEEILDDMSPLYKLFPENLIRFFTGDDSLPSDKELRKLLLRKLKNKWDRAVDFLTRLEKFNQWKNELGKLREKDPQATLPKPVCTSEEVLNPPRTCEISDATLIAWVFRYFNLYLENDRKFRQLPPGEQHRGPFDHEYQTVHALIGKYSMDPRGLQYYIQTHKQELLPAWNDLNAPIAKLRKEAEKQRKTVLDKNGKPKRMGVSLSMLAQAAAECYITYCEKEMDRWEKTPPSDPEKLRKMCRKFSIRTGMPLDRNALIKTVLKIDLSKWMTAFDRESGKNYENRSLEQCGHIISQIPFPADFMQKVMCRTRNRDLQQFIRKAEGKAPVFDFSAAFVSMPLEIAPRDYYDTKPLLEAALALKAGKNLDSIAGLKVIPEEGFPQADFSRSAVDKVIRHIKETANRDKILLKIAYAYREKFQMQGGFLCRERKQKTSGTVMREIASVYDYFKTDLLIKFPDEKDERCIVLHPNDVNRPILSQIYAYAKPIAQVMDPDGIQQEFEFYEMLKCYRSIQAADRTKRLELIPLIRVFDEAISIPSSCYEGKTLAEKRNMEFAEYLKKFRFLTREDYELIVNTRNEIFHRGFNLKTGNLERVLKKYVSLPVSAPVKKKPCFKR